MHDPRASQSKGSSTVTWLECSPPSNSFTFCCKTIVWIVCVLCCARLHVHAGIKHQCIDRLLWIQIHINACPFALWFKTGSSAWQTKSWQPGKSDDKGCVRWFSKVAAVKKFADRWKPVRQHGDSKWWLVLSRLIRCRGSLNLSNSFQSSLNILGCP